MTRPTSWARRPSPSPSRMTRSWTNYAKSCVDYLQGWGIGRPKVLAEVARLSSIESSDAAQR